MKGGEVLQQTAVSVTVTVNGTRHTVDVEPRTLLVHLLRDTLGLTGTHIGCDTSQCGACTVLLDGQAVKSCTVLAVQADGCEITTVEGLAQNGELHAVQKGFWEKHGLQCGYCTPGVMMTAYGLLQKNPQPDAETIRRELDGVYCRCTGYQNIVRAIEYAAAELAGAGSAREAAAAGESGSGDGGGGGR